MTTDKNQRQEEKAQMLECALPVKNTILTGKSGQKYKILAVLGAGGFGITYKAVSEVKVKEGFSAPMFFAIKEHFMKGCYRDTDKTHVLCPPTMRTDVEQSREDFRTEAERLMKLNGQSPNIVKVNEWFDANGTRYYVMEYLDGQTLDKYAAGRPLSEAKALSLLLPVARAVELVHQEKLLHLDIKPDNIVLKTDFASGATIPVLIDFGLAKHFDGRGRPTSHLVAKGATEGYAPMEQYGEITRFAPEIDVYALGATLFFLLTGKNPPRAFDIQTVTTLMERLPADVSPRVKQALMGAMQRNNFDRTQTVTAFIGALEGEKSHKMLPVGYVLRGGKVNYVITEVVRSAPFYIVYKARLAGKSLDASTVTGGNVTQTLASYYIYEWSAQGPGKESEASLAQFHAEMQKLMPPVLDQYDEHGHLESECFEANNTYYYACLITPQPSNLQRIIEEGAKILDVVKKGAKPVALVAVALLCCYGGYRGVRWYQNRPQGVVWEDTTTVTPDTIVTPDSNTDVIQGGENVSEDTVDIKPDPTPAPPASRVKTDDELFAEARTLSDYKALADKGYAKAYYPLAKKYLDAGNLDAAKRWAEKAVAAGVDRYADLLLSEVEYKQYSQAYQRGDWNTIRRMADGGYKEAYATLATHYLQANDYANADKYAQKAYAAGTNTDDAKKVMQALKALGYYDDKEVPAWIK